MAGRDDGAMEYGRRWTRTRCRAAWIDQIRDDAAAARLSPQERRPVRRSSRVHRVLGPARGSQWRPVSRRHQPGRGPCLPSDAMDYDTALQEGAGWKQVGPDSVRCEVL